MNKLELRLWAMKRSGQHAIIDWITAHTKGPILHVNNPLYELDNRFYHNVTPIAAKRDGKAAWIDKSLYLFNVEDANLTKHPRLVENNLPIRNWGPRRRGIPSVPAPSLKRGPSKRVVDLLVMRDPANFWASRIRVVDQQKKRPKEWFGPRALHKYRHYLREVLNQTQYLKHERTLVQFERWTVEEEYRSELGTHLGLIGDFQKQYEKISKFGGGSSFGRKGEIDTVNARWKLMKSDPRLKTIFRTIWAWPEIQQLYGDNPIVVEAAEQLLA